jgi:hypothetical protein
MSIRTYIRTSLDRCNNNVLIKAIRKIVNFYCDLFSNPKYSLKFSREMPKSLLERKKSISFQSVTGDKIDCK